MQATEIDKDRFGGEFENSVRVTNGDSLEVAEILEFTSKEKNLRGVSLTLKDGSKRHTTAKQPVGYILSPNLNLKGLIEKASDGCVTLFFKERISNTNRPMLSCSIYENGN